MANYFDATHIESAIEPEVSDQNSNNELEFKFENVLIILMLHNIILLPLNFQQMWMLNNQN